MGGGRRGDDAWRRGIFLSGDLHVAAGHGRDALNPWASDKVAQEGGAQVSTSMEAR